VAQAGTQQWWPMALFSDTYAPVNLSRCRPDLQKNKNLAFTLAAKAPESPLAVPATLSVGPRHCFFVCSLGQSAVHQGAGECGTVIVSFFLPGRIIRRKNLDPIIRTSIGSVFFRLLDRIDTDTNRNGRRQTLFHQLHENSQVRRVWHTSLGRGHFTDTA